MTKEVVKRHGGTEKFDKDKLKKAIKAAAEEAGLMGEKLKEVVDETLDEVMDFLSDKERVHAAAIRDAVLMHLDKTEAAVAKAWRKHESEHKGR
ncbi:MAG TPA: ATP cone domain-containing protein [Candidatus Colwellbacteria bacterium]|nr:ATP cone domain-containing protein [Candidatus Colwellbacteria bacterium]